MCQNIPQWMPILIPIDQLRYCLSFMRWIYWLVTSRFLFQRKQSWASWQIVVTHVLWCMPEYLTSSFLWSQWWGKCPQHSRRMRDPKYYISSKRPMWNGLQCHTVILFDLQHGIWCDVCRTGVNFQLFCMQLRIPKWHRSHLISTET